MPRLISGLFAAAFLVSPLIADRVITEDGRIITPKKAREEADCSRLTFESGEILLPTKEGIKAIEIEAVFDPGDAREFGLNVMLNVCPSESNGKDKSVEMFVPSRFGPSGDRGLILY